MNQTELIRFVLCHILDREDGILKPRRRLITGDSPNQINTLGRQIWANLKDRPSDDHEHNNNQD